MIQCYKFKKKTNKTPAFYKEELIQKLNSAVLYNDNT